MASVVQHLIGVALFALFTVAPVPLALCAVAAWQSDARIRGLPAALLALLTVWCVLQAVVVHVLGVLRLVGFPAFVVVQLALLAAGTYCAACLGVRWEFDARRLLAAKPLEVVTLLAVAFMLLTLSWWVMAMPVVDWDSWAFHMPVMVQWLQDGTFTRLAQELGRARGSYPFGWEAMSTLFLTPFGEDMLVTFPNLLAWVMLGLATYLLARRWGARRDHALASASLLLAIHYVADPLNTMHVDMQFAALFLTSVYFGTIYRLGGAPTSLGLAAAAVGLACATRVTGPVYAVFLAVWLLFVRRGAIAGGGGASPSAGLRRAGRAVLIGGVAAGVFLGAFWYTKNVIELGHPLGSGAPKSGDATQKGSLPYLASITLAGKFDPLRAGYWKALVDRSFHELDVPFVTLAVLALLWPLTFALGSRPAAAAAGRPPPSDLALALLVTGTLAVFWFTPAGALSAIQVRLGLVSVASLAVAAAVGATRAGVRAEVPAALALVSAARTFSQSRVLYLLVVLGIVWAAWRGLRIAGPRRRMRASVAVALAVVALTAVTWVARGRRDRESRAMHGAFHAYLEDHVDPAEPIAYLYGERSYLIYGRRLARRVFHMPYRSGEATADWVGRLRQQGIRFVAIGPWFNDERVPPILGILTAPAGPLVAVSGKGGPGDVTIYRLPDGAVD